MGRHFIKDASYPRIDLTTWVFRRFVTVGMLVHETSAAVFPSESLLPPPLSPILSLSLVPTQGARQKRFQEGQLLCAVNGVFS